jgi:hypothetical protein
MAKAQKTTAKPAPVSVDPRMPPGYGKAAPPTPPRDPILGLPIMVYFIPGPPTGTTADFEAIYPESDAPVRDAGTG